MTVSFFRRIKNYNGYQLKENDTATLQNAPFIKNKQVIVSSHGYTGHLHYAPNPELIDGKLYFQKFKLIL